MKENVTPGVGRDKSFPFKVAFAPLECVQLGILKFNVDTAPLEC